jgi:hypothetical protein
MITAWIDDYGLDIVVFDGEFDVGPLRAKYHYAAGSTLGI